MSRKLNRVPFDAVVTKIVAKAIQDSLAEIERAMGERFGDGRDASGDWWKPDPEDPFWMIEVRQGYENAGAWVKNEHTCLTTRDPTKALRYPSNWAADCARKRLYPLDGRYVSTEHLWCAFPAQGMEARSAETGTGLAEGDSPTRRGAP
jgi:hypothetical protein